jgi:hypothetical protein
MHWPTKLLAGHGINDHFLLFQKESGLARKKSFVPEFGMENDVEHVGKDLGIDGKSSTSSSSSSNSDAESSSSSSLSDKSEECVITTPASDRFRKRSYQSTSIQSFFVKQPKHSSLSLPHSTFENGEETSTRVVKQWSDPLNAKDKKPLKAASCEREKKA